ncbi:DUF2986 domain-containing protein [Vibrio maerlii]|uniref:DUF2986 domain-containing protein n=1 Tax=Vibrio maerlii TaxID=2231648 RepID=UPI000E3D2A3A|nr:DUF2986 domain-containing protein [Vibrio maerlii]
MNRKKKINETLKKKLKKKNAKLHKSNKPRYISKAERAKLEAEEQANQGPVVAETADSTEKESAAE